MSKWNKTDKPLTEEFLQNEERRRQMIIEASKKRREREQKLAEINENMRKNELQALEKHKKEKQEAVNKYLKNQNNMHDKYESIKRNEKMENEPKANVGKWRKREKSEEKTNVAQDLPNPKMDKVGYSHMAKEKASVEEKVNGVKQAMVKEFEKEWGSDNEDSVVVDNLMTSKLIDSLDLDIGTIERGKEISYGLEEEKKKEGKSKKNEVDELKNLIGYDSMLISIDERTENENTKKNTKVTEKEKEGKTDFKKKTTEVKNVDKKEPNEQEVFNNLKNKKEGKILEWANNETEEADDLFSNCSSKKNSILTKQENKGSNKLLDVIQEKTKPENKSQEKLKPFSNKSVEKERPPLRPSFEKKQQSSLTNESKEIKNPSERSAKVLGHRREGSQENISNQNRSISKEKKSGRGNILEREKDRSIEKLRERKFSAERTNSAEKTRPKVSEQMQAQKTQQPFRISKGQMPAIPRPTYTVATHEEMFDVESFIKNDLLQLNEEERKLQEELRNIHINNKEKIKEIYSKNEIKTNYKTTANLIKHHHNTDDFEVSDVDLGSYANKYNVNQNEDLIEDSVQRLDDLLIKRDLASREKVGDKESERNDKSIINPFSKPEDFQKQILQLAENISRFENEPNEDVKGYGYQNRIKKPHNKQEIPNEVLCESKNLSELPKNSNKGKIDMPHPPMLEFSGKDSRVVEVNMEEYSYEVEDSLESTPNEKIKVNEKFRNLLLD